MRTLTKFVNDDVVSLLGVLADKGASVDAYRNAMKDLGGRLAKNLVAEKPSMLQATVCVICTAEDADFLARGVLDGFNQQGFDSTHLKLICFWNERIRKFDDSDAESFDIAPIVKRYEEPTDVATSVFVVVKSIISGACVVKTNIAALIENSLPKEVIVLAPVMAEGAQEKLANEFPPATAKLFEYVTYAIDDEVLPDHTVVPGIGGWVYERLGIADHAAYVPEIVRQRRRVLSGSR